MDSLLFFIVLAGAMYALLFLPQQRKMKAHQALLRALEPGDVVVTASGIHGAIAEIEDGIVWLEVAPEVELKLAVGAIAEVLEHSDDDSDDDEEDHDSDDEDLDGDDDTDDELAAAEDDA